MRKRLLYKNILGKIQLLILLLIVASISVQAQTFNLAGSAIRTEEDQNFITLTERIADQNGAAWSTNKIDLRYNFNIKFILNFGTGSTGGADGMTFTLQKASNTIVGSPFGGSYLGIYGISPALTVEYDALGGGPPFNDLSQAHLGLDKNGDATSSGKLIAEVPAFDNGTSVMFDGNNHTSRVVWNATTKKLFVYFDEVLKITYSADIVATIFGTDPLVYFGFTGATGGYTEIQSVTYDPTSTFATEGGTGPAYTTTNTSISQINALCNGGSNGSIAVTPTGGTAPYTLALTGRATVTNPSGAAYTFTNLSAGSYTLTTTDIFGNSKVDNIQITEPALPVITTSTGSVILCPNTSLDLTVLASEKNLLFNNGYAEAPSTPAIQLTSQITLEAWVKLSDVSGFQYIVSKGNYDAAGDGQYGLALKDGRFNAHMSKANFAPGNAHVELIATNLVVQPNVWYHVVSTWDGITYKIYINGNLENSMLATFTMTPTNEPLEIGRLGQPNGYLGYSYHYPIKGQIDELRIWNTAKSSAEINANKDKKVLATSPNLVAYYSFDEGTGTTLSDAVNGNTAILHKLDASNDVSGVLVGNLPQWQNSTAPIYYTSISWDPSPAFTNTIQATTAGTYKAYVTTIDGCNYQTAPLLLVTPTPLVTTHTASGPLTFCTGGSVTLTADATAVSYSWTRVFGGVTTNNFATGKSIVVTQPGTYFVNVTDANGCIYNASQSQYSTVFVSPTIIPVIASSNTSDNIVCATVYNNLHVLASGKSVLFNAGYAEAINPSIASISNQFTIEAWVKPSDPSNSLPQYLVSRGKDDQVNGQFGMMLYQGKFRTHLWNGGPDLIGTTTPLANKWYHVAFTWDGVTQKLYVNGNLENSSATSVASIPSNSNLLEIGRLGLNARGWGNYEFYGEMDEVRIWKAAKSNAEILANMELNVALSSANLIANYSFDEGTGTTVSDAVSGNTANLVSISTLPTWQDSKAQIFFSNYLWSNGATTKVVAINAAGTYTVNLTSANGCTYSPAAYTLVGPPKPVITPNGPTTFCAETASLTLSTSSTTATNVWTPFGYSGNTIPVFLPGEYDYTVTATYPSGCSAISDPLHVSILPAPTQYAVSGGGDICAGSSSQINLSNSQVGVRYTLIGGSTSPELDGTGSAISFTNITEAGTYLIIARNTTTNCSYSMAGNATVTVKAVPATPVITSSTGKFDFCAGSSINLISSASTGNLWSIGGSTANQITVNSSSNYTVTVTGANGCTATSASVTTTSVALPAVGSSVSNYKPIFCEGEIANYYVPNPNADLTYKWYRIFKISATNWGNEEFVGNGSTYNATAAIYPTEVGYIVYATNSTGCTWSSGIIPLVTVAATKPTITTSTGKTEFCAEQGGSVSLISSGVSNTNIWSTGATTNNITINSVGTNNYTVSSLDANGCRATSDPITITGATIPAAPGISVTNNEFCAGSSVTFTVPNPDPSLTYQWLISVGGAFATDIPGATGTSYIANTADRFTVRAKNAGGCSIISGTIQLFLKNVTAPVMNLTSTASCGGIGSTTGSVQFTGVVAPFVNWKNSLGTVISTNPFVPNLGGGTYTASAQDACGVIYSKSIVVESPAPINAIITNSAGTNTLCAGSSTTLTATASPGAGYAWYKSVGGAAATYYSSAQAIIVNATADYYVQIQDAFGCSSTSSTTIINVLPAPTAALDISVTSTNNCIGNFTGSATAAFVPNTGSGTPTFNGWTGPNGFTSNSLSINNRPAGTYTATAVDFCGVTASKSVTILAPITQFVVSGGGAYCAGGAGVSINLSGSEIGVRYELIKDLINQGIFIDGTGGAIAFNNITAAGNYLIRSERTADACAIMASSSATVSVTAYPQVFTVTGGVTFCSSDIANFTFTLDGTTSGTNYAIHRNDGSTDVITNTFVGTGNSISFNLGTPTSNTTTYTITGTSATGGCTVAMNGAATFIRLASPAIPTITASGSTTFCPSSSVTLTSSASTNNVWMPGTISGNSISVNQTGSYTVTTTAANGCKATSAAISVTAQDNIAPVAVVGALPNLIIPVNGLVTSPTATDNCGIGVIIGTPSIPITNLAQGVYTIVWTYTDNSGNSSTQTQSVTVSSPATPPAFKTLVDIVKNNDLGICGATVNYTMPLANGDASTTKVNITEGGGDGIISFDIPLANKVSSLDFITTGEYKDIVHGHGENISVNVELFNPSSGLWTVVQTIQTGTGDYHFGGTSMSFPEITQVSKIRFTASQPVLAAFHFYEMNVNLNSIKIIQTGGLASGAVFPVGETVNTFTATDMFGNAAQASFKVTILDAEKPTISNTSSTQKYADATGAYTGSGGTISFNDNCANALSVKESYFNQQGVLFLEATTPVTQGSLVLAARRYPLGINTVMLTATDAAGNATVSKFNLTVLDTTKPIIVRPTNITRTADLGSCGASINVEPPVVSDNCSVASISVTSSNGGTGARGLYPVGTTTLTWKVKDGSGNESIATQTITVTDNQAPYINGVPNNIFRTNDAGTCGAVVTWAAVTASDNCSVVTVFTSDHVSGETFPLGVTTVNYSARDQYNNVKTASFTITVTDNEAPTVRTKPWTVTLVNGSASISTANINNGTTDNCVGAITYSLSKTLFSCADVGTNLVTLTATDVSGNSSSATAIVTVVGQKLTSSITASATSAVFTGGVPTNLYIGYGPQTVNLSNIVVGSIGVTYAWSGVGISANTTGQSTVFTAPGAGLYTITCTATNSFGCTTTSTIAICVRDIRQSATANSPVFVCHTDMKTGATSTLVLGLSAVANQLSTNPQDKLGSCGMAPCTQTPTAIANVITADTIVVQNKISMPEKVAEKLTVKVSPNPSATSFTFIISSKNKQKVSVQIMDGAGRMMEANNNAPIEATFRMGEKLISGMYYAVFIQGQERVVVKLIKQDRF